MARAKAEQSSTGQSPSFTGTSPDGLLPILGEVNMAANGQVFCYLNAGIEVRLGYGEDYSEKLKLLWELLETLNIRQCRKLLNILILLRVNLFWTIVEE